MESCSRIKDGNGRQVEREDEVQKTWKNYFGDLYNIDKEEDLTFHMCGFSGGGKGKYLGGDPVGRTEVEVKVKKTQKWKDKR